jgi:hypothetical protein
MAVSLAFTSAGTTLYVSAALPATNDAAGFGALAWTKVGEIVDLGSYGKKYNLVTHNPLDDRKTVKRKGSYNNGTLSVKMARVPANAGQAIIVAGRDSDNSISCRDHAAKRHDQLLPSSSHVVHD